MSDADPQHRLDTAGPAAPPRANGELVFEAPWQSRVFGMTMALCDSGAIDWASFRAGLIREIGAWDAAHDEHEAYAYWSHWLRALTTLLAERDILAATELDAKTAGFAARPHGHDH